MKMVEKDPKGTLKRAERALTAQPQQSDAGWLWATISVAELLLDRADEASVAAERGLQVIKAQPNSSARLQLLVLQAGTSEDEPTALAAIARLEHERKALKPGSPADICTLDAIGELQHAIDRPQAATRSLASAYRMTETHGREAERAWLAMMNAAVLVRAHDVDGAMSMMEESASLARTHDLPITLANGLYQRGLYLIGRKDFRGALASLAESTAIADKLQGPESAAYAAMGACEASLELGQLTRAHRLCDTAAGPLAKTQSTKKVSLLQARLALADGHPHDALAHIAKVLDGKTETATSTIATDALEVRARARAVTGDPRGAFADMSEFARRIRKSYSDVLEKQTAELRAQLKANQQEAQNSALRNELRLAGERDRSERKLYMLAGGAALLTIALLAYTVLLGRRHRVRLMRVADTDVLTGLPNRRAMIRAGEDKDPTLSVALIDLDRFKELNDLYGHDVGDAALQVFAQTSRAVLRATDIVGRWGGEEFLILLPQTSQQTAIGVIERLRIATALIELPLAPGRVLTFSAGIATRTGETMSLDALVVAADGAMYRAKDSGRNCTAVADIVGPFQSD